MKMDEYLTKMKSLADNLELAGSALSTFDLCNQILAGLDADYTPIVSCDTIVLYESVLG